MVGRCRGSAFGAAPALATKNCGVGTERTSAGRRSTGEAGPVRGRDDGQKEEDYCIRRSRSIEPERFTPRRLRPTTHHTHRRHVATRLARTAMSSYKAFKRSRDYEESDDDDDDEAASRGGESEDDGEDYADGGAKLTWEEAVVEDADERRRRVPHSCCPS